MPCFTEDGLAKFTTARVADWSSDKAYGKQRYAYTAAMTAALFEDWHDARGMRRATPRSEAQTREAVEARVAVLEALACRCDAALSQLADTAVQGELGHVVKAAAGLAIRTTAAQKAGIPPPTATMATTAARQGRSSAAAKAEAAGEAKAAETPSSRGRRRGEASPGPGASGSARRETQRRTEGLDSALGVVWQLSAAHDELFGFRNGARATNRVRLRTITGLCAKARGLTCVVEESKKPKSPKSLKL